MNHSSQTDTLTLLADHDRQTYFTIFFLFCLSYCPVGWPAQKWGQQKYATTSHVAFNQGFARLVVMILVSMILIYSFSNAKLYFHNDLRVFERGIIWLSMATVLAALFIGHLLVIRYSHPIGNALHTYIRDANSLHICCK